MRRSELVIHPVRLRILQALGRDAMTTQELADELGDVPKSSLYRHLQLLRSEGLVVSEEARTVNGIIEKRYHLWQPAALGVEDMAELTPDEHSAYFTTYLMTLLRGFESYMRKAAGEDGLVDLRREAVGYREVSFYASDAELAKFSQVLNKALLPLLANEEDGRRRYKLATIMHPLDAPKELA